MTRSKTMGSARLEHPVAGIARIVLVQEGKKNAIDVGMRNALGPVLAEVISAPDISAIILTGADGDFCAGGDIDGLTSLDLTNFESWLAIGQDLIRVLADCPKPVVAAVAGACAGGGLGFMLCADTIIASESAKFACGFSGIGLVPDLGVLHSLPRRIGIAPARRFLHSPRPIDVAAALAIDLIDTVVADADLQAAAIAEAERLAAFSPLAFAKTKQVLNAPPMTLDALLAAENEAQAACIRSAEFRARSAAFLARRAGSKK